MGSSERDIIKSAKLTSEFKLTLHRIPVSPSFTAVQAAEDVNIELSPAWKNGEVQSPGSLKPIHRKSKRFCLLLCAKGCFTLWKRRKTTEVSPASGRTYDIE